MDVPHLSAPPAQGAAAEPASGAPGTLSPGVFHVKHLALSMEEQEGGDEDVWPLRGLRHREVKGFP